MLEEWVWNPTILKNISRHYSYLSDQYKQTWLEDSNSTEAEQPEERMPDDLIERLIQNRNFNIGLTNLRQIAFATYDMRIHTPATHQDIMDLDLTVLWNQNFVNVGLLRSMEELIDDESKKWRFGQRQASFGHFMGGYDAGYYGYMR
ncbi:Peptidase M3A/M3B [Macrophomina phaseolina MS6]|uniref:Peptidase M3A/M3B n=1 Tax=Macrophomina phaseolina (strain MS6) TaxID=1126212 RepID=K2RZ78_MACPH|nr:Peptidase M3A/M3B [Macrophomina phaseolina MS6]